MAKVSVIGAGSWGTACRPAERGRPACYRPRDARRRVLPEP